MIFKMSRALLLLWIFVGIPLNCVAQSGEEKEAEKTIADSTAVLKEVNDAVTEVTRVATSVDDTNLPSPPVGVPAAITAKTLAETRANEAKNAREKLKAAREKGAEVLARLDRHKIAMVAWNAEADTDDAAVNPVAKFNAEEARKATALGDRIDAAIAALATTGPLAENGKRAAAADGAATTAVATAATSMQTALTKYWAARNVEDAAGTITEMTAKATALRDRATGGLTTAANGARDTAANVLIAANGVRVSKNKDATQKALRDAEAVLAQARTLEDEALDLQSEVAEMDRAIKVIQADALNAERVAILLLTDAARDAIGTAAVAGINSARIVAGGAAAARDPGSIQKAIEDADLAIVEAKRVLSLLDAMDDIAKSVEQMKTTVETATSERQRSKSEHDKTAALQTDADAAVTSAQAAQRVADTAAKLPTATAEDKDALKTADDDLLKVTEARTKVTEQITAAGTEDAKAEAARVIVAGRSAAATTASSDIDTNIGTVATATVSYGDRRKFLARLRVAAAKNGVGAVTTAANAVAKSFMDAQSALGLAKRWAEKANDQTPEGRKKADQVAERVIQEDIDARTAEANRLAMEKAMKLAQATQQAQQQAAQEQTDMTNQQQDQQTQQQIQNQLPVDANGGIVNIDHLYDDVYVQPAAGDSDVNCLNNLHRCSEPTIAAQCAGTCTRQDNGDDHADNCAGMTDLCLEDHYRDLMSTYCVGTCG